MDLRWKARGKPAENGGQAGFPKLDFTSEDNAYIDNGFCQPPQRCIRCIGSAHCFGGCYLD